VLEALLVVNQPNMQANKTNGKVKFFIIFFSILEKVRQVPDAVQTPTTTAHKKRGSAQIGTHSSKHINFSYSREKFYKVLVGLLTFGLKHRPSQFPFCFWEINGQQSIDAFSILS
jgi:hypothetical protein